MGLQDYRPSANTYYARVQSLSDRVVSRDTRQQFYSNLSSFASDQPYLASFLFVQLVLSFTPIAIFISFTIATILFAFITALLFSLFWTGAALLLLIPTLFVTVSLAIAIWIWAIGSFLLARWVYTMIPLSVRGGAVVDMPNGKSVVVNKTGAGYGDVDAKVKPTSGTALGTEYVF